jgi:hypothetical protein
MGGDDEVARSARQEMAQQRFRAANAGTFVRFEITLIVLPICTTVRRRGGECGGIATKSGQGSCLFVVP